jgi:hypothetical protein
MDRLRQEIEEERREFNVVKERHSTQVMNCNKKIDKLKDSLKDEIANKDHAIREQYRDRMEEIQQIINDSQTVFNEKADVVHKLNKTIVKKVNNYERVTEMKDLGKREATMEYKTILEEQKTQHKKEISNLKAQYEYLLSEKEKEFEKFVNEFKVYHSHKKEEIHSARDEIVNLYKVCKKLQNIIDNVEKGVYTNGIRSAYIPQKEKPKIPDRYTSKFLNKALNKSRVETPKTWKREDSAVDKAISDDEKEAETIMQKIQKNESATDSKCESKDSKNIVGSEGIRKETLDQLIAERDRFKSLYQNEVKKNNNSKIVIESQKRLIERTKVESLAKKAGGYDLMRPKTQNRFI